MINASNNPFPCEPNGTLLEKLDREGYAGTAQDLKDEIDSIIIPDKITKVGIVTLSGTTISVDALEFEGNISSISYTNLLGFISEVNLAGIGNKRVDVFVLTNSNAIVKIEGAITVGAFLKIAAPQGTLECFYLEIDGNTISNPITPDISSDPLKLDRGGYAGTAQDLKDLIDSIVISGGGDKNYLHTQGVPSTVWTIAHGLAKYPSVIVIDSGGTVVEGAVNYIDLNNLTITFSAGFSGTATIN